MGFNSGFKGLIARIPSVEVQLRCTIVFCLFIYTDTLETIAGVRDCLSVKSNNCVRHDSWILSTSWKDFSF